jgi:hypothetical protein
MKRVAPSIIAMSGMIARDDGTRRIRAMTAACENISTEALEAGVVDKLVEALEWAMSELRGQTRYNDPQQALNCFDLADAALALARGEQSSVSWTPEARNACATRSGKLYAPCYSEGKPVPCDHCREQPA